MKYALISKVTTKPNKRNETIQLLLQISEIITTSSDVLYYAISEDMANPNVIWIEETWKSKESHAYAHSLSEVVPLLNQAMHLIDGLPAQNELHTVGGKKV